MRVIITAPRLDLEATFNCGQTFRFKRDGDRFYGMAGMRPLVAQHTSDGVALTVAAEADIPFWRGFFDIDRDYDAVFERCGADAARQAYHQYPGLRVLNQPPWDAICSFIVSANNNIKRITGILERLAINWGETVIFEGYDMYALPTPEAIVSAGEAELKRIGLGYRAPYLYKSASMIAEGDLDMEAIPRMPYDDARKTLMRLPGVGDKVCDCVLLFGFGFAQAVPVDVWMERALAREGFTGTRAQMKRQAMARYGAHGGILQQVMFHAIRNGAAGE